MVFQKPIVTILTAATGHASIAQAVAAALPPSYQTQIHNVSIPGFSLYYPFYRYFPQLSQIGFKASQRKTVYQTFQKLLGDSYRLKITKIIAQDRPDLIISTYYLANPTLEPIITHTPFINIITDPRTISAFLPSTQALNFVFDQKAFDYCHQALKIPAKNLTVSGWFVRPEYKPANKTLIRRKLALSPDQLCLLLAAGSEGTNLILKIIPTFLSTAIPLTVFVACGNNQLLFDTVEKINQANCLLHKHAPVRLIPLRFVDNLYQYMQASDLVIGKAGPNLLFESVATHTPFFAITHISGQEDGNLDLIQDLHLGYVEENPLKANRLLKKIISHSQLLSTYKPHLEKLARHNQRAPKILLKALSAMIKAHSS